MWVRSKPLIHQVCSRSDGGVSHGGRIPETRGDVLTKGLWESQTEAIVDVKFRDANTETYKTEVIDKLFPRWEKMKQYKHKQHCQDQRKRFSPSFLSLNGMVGKEAQVVLATLSQLMDDKMEEPILHVTVWVNGRVSIGFTRLYSWMLF